MDENDDRQQYYDGGQQQQQPGRRRSSNERPLRAGPSHTPSKPSVQQSSSSPSNNTTDCQDRSSFAKNSEKEVNKSATAENHREVLEGCEKDDLEEKDADGSSGESSCSSVIHVQPPTSRQQEENEQEERNFDNSSVPPPYGGMNRSISQVNKGTVMGGHDTSQKGAMGHPSQKNASSNYSLSSEGGGNSSGGGLVGLDDRMSYTSTVSLASSYFSDYFDHPSNLPPPSAVSGYHSRAVANLRRIKDPDKRDEAEMKLRIRHRYRDTAGELWRETVAVAVAAATANGGRNKRGHLIHFGNKHHDHFTIIPAASVPVSQRADGGKTGAEAADVKNGGTLQQRAYAYVSNGNDAVILPSPVGSKSLQDSIEKSRQKSGPKTKTKQKAATSTPTADPGISYVTTTPTNTSQQQQSSSANKLTKSKKKTKQQAASTTRPPSALNYYYYQQPDDATTAGDPSAIRSRSTSEIISIVPSKSAVTAVGRGDSTPSTTGSLSASSSASPKRRMSTFGHGTAPTAAPPKNSSSLLEQGGGDSAAFNHDRSNSQKTNEVMINSDGDDNDEENEPDIVIYKL